MDGVNVRKILACVRARARKSNAIRRVLTHERRQSVGNLNHRFMFMDDTRCFTPPVITIMKKDKLIHFEELGKGKKILSLFSYDHFLSSSNSIISFRGMGGFEAGNSNKIVKIVRSIGKGRGIYTRIYFQDEASGKCHTVFAQETERRERAREAHR